MPRQAWWCEDCGARGYVDHDEHAGVYEVLHAIGDDHREKREGKCDGMHIRVQNEAWVDA